MKTAIIFVVGEQKKVFPNIMER